MLVTSEFPKNFGTNLVDEELADRVWEAWDAREIDDSTAWLAWWQIIGRAERHGTESQL